MKAAFFTQLHFPSKHMKSRTVNTTLILICSRKAKIAPLSHPVDLLKACRVIVEHPDSCDFPAT